MSRAAHERPRHRALKSYLRDNLYRHFRVHRMTLKAGRIVTALFEIFMDDPNLALFHDLETFDGLGVEQGDVLALGR